MERSMFARFASDLKRLGAEGVGAPEFSLGRDGKYALQYIPFEYVNREARLVLVGITPGNTQLELAYAKAQELLYKDKEESEILVEVKKAGAFGGPSMRPNLLKMLRHFQFEKLLHIDDVESLWTHNAHLLHSTSVVPHAAFKAGERFNGSFDEILHSPLLTHCFLECFVPTVQEVSQEALFVALGPCPQAALEWCVAEKLLRRDQVLGAFCHPSSAGGSTTRYYLREVARDALDANNPVRSRCDWLDAAYQQMLIATSALLSQTPKISPLDPCIRDTVLMRPERVRVSKKATTERVPRTKAEVPTSEEIDAILDEVRRAGYALTHATAKLSALESPSGQTLYLVKTTSRLNAVYLMVHPRHDPEVLRRLDGVDAVSDTPRFHSNMTRFPKRMNKGKTETAFGWQIRIASLTELSRFLVAFGVLHS